MTLSKALVPSNSLVSKALLVLGGSALIAVAAQVQVPMIPVPMTLQTLAVLLVGLSLGARMGAATLIAYLAEGAAGLPVFAGGANGVALAGPTAGFLFGFVGMAWIAGLAASVVSSRQCWWRWSLRPRCTCRALPGRPSRWACRWKRC